MAGSVAGPSRLGSAHASVFVLSWVFFSNLTILFNKFLIDTVGFRFPVILTCWHMIFATAATQLLARTTRLLDSRHAVRMTRRAYLRSVVPIGVMYSASMVCSTLVYLYLSVPFIQMLKASAPAVVLLVGWLWGVEHPTARKIVNIAGIIAGVVVASAGEVHFSWAGFLYQLGGLLFESLRVIMIQALFTSSDDNNNNNNVSTKRSSSPTETRTKDDIATSDAEQAHHESTAVASARYEPSTPSTGGSGGSSSSSTQLHKMDPLVGLYYYAPICAVTNLVISVLWEGPSFRWHRDVAGDGPGRPALLLLNALAAFLLNVSSVLLIGKTSGLVLVLTGILKNILLVAFAVVFTGEAITAVQVLGYSAALLGLVTYQADLGDLRRVAATMVSFAGGGSGVVSRLSRRRRGSKRLVAVVLAGCLLMGACLAYGLTTWRRARRQDSVSDVIDSWSLTAMFSSLAWLIQGPSKS